MKASKAWLLGQFERAALLCESEKAAGYPDCMKLAGLARRQLGDEQAACRHLRDYLAADPYDADQMRAIIERIDCSTPDAGQQP